MFSPDLIVPARLDEATGLSLLLPRSSYEFTFLIAQSDDGHIAIIIDDNEKAFTSFRVEDGNAWKGALLSNLHIEVDEQSLVDPDQQLIPLGTLVREGSSLWIAARPPVASVIGRYLLPLSRDLPVGSPGIRLGFRRWQLVLGDGDDRRVVRSFSF